MTALMLAPEVRPLAAPSPKPPLKPPPSGRGPTPARPRARVLLYDGSVEGSPVALGEVCAEACEGVDQTAKTSGTSVEEMYVDGKPHDGRGEAEL